MSPHLPLGAEAEAFLAENHQCTLTTLRPDGTPHVAPVRFTWDGETGTVRVMTTVSRRKVRNILAGEESPVAVCQSAGPRWITLEGLATVSTDPARVGEGIRRYTERYWSPPPRFPGLAVVEIVVERVMGLY
ncbi:MULTISPECIES: pyridoxamine 5'-phosphate oxidase family protein [unclassified Streptomyces]|uniref:pyridoxamine 5'-phosphate oxidase family protein n=1 Tax=unclassified Streptomyces TaxID=2593676 RepID=UPI0016601E61|nr:MULTISPECIES: TIGR03618 family F420-dependent PPOX class oxidoreductase [unclassified Streptomyces]MBD0707896.1 pyridoxamine 5'-phosphate oxidase [Streptomyces sp. CBMA291]MBD0717597.1 pyridoxamine 5'-phosphate oxidase [Streptomyces sp. CBMA370]